MDSEVGGSIQSVTLNMLELYSEYSRSQQASDDMVSKDT